MLDTLSDSTSSATANDLDLIFLKGIMESPVVSFFFFLVITMYNALAMLYANKYFKLKFETHTHTVVKSNSSKLIIDD